MLRVQRSLDHGRISGRKHLGSIRHSLKSLKHLAAPLPGGKLTSESESSPIQNDSAVGTVAGVSNLLKSQQGQVQELQDCGSFSPPHPFLSLPLWVSSSKDFVLGPIHSYLGAQAAQRLQAGHAWLPEALASRDLTSTADQSIAL